MPTAQPYASYPQQRRQPYRRPAAPARQPVARGQSPAPSAAIAKPKAPPPDPGPIVMPSPEQLGLRTDTPAPAPAPAGEDWLPLLRRLDAHGMTRFEFSPHGGEFRFACELPGDRRVEAVGATKAEVLRKALGEVEAGASN